MTSLQKRIRRIAIIGFGPYARHSHFPLLETFSKELGLEVVLVADLETERKTVERYFANRDFQPARLRFIPNQFRHSQELSPELAADLGELVTAGELDGVIISTEPQSHRIYLEWAAANGIDALVDKPLTARPMTDLAAPRELLKDYRAIKRAFDRSKATATVMINKRAHPGYAMIRECLGDFVEQHGIAPTFIDVYHANGVWYLPDELFGRENHPYKYGYGVLLHDGYHAFDLWQWYLGTALRLGEASAPDSLTLATAHVRGTDFLAQVPPSVHARLFGTSSAEIEENRSSVLGETDFQMLLQARRGDRVMTSGSLQTLQTCVSARSWRDLPVDTFKHNGRVVGERVNIHVGHLFNIEAAGHKTTGAPDDDGQGTEEFRITVRRNSGLVGGSAVEHFSFADGEKGETIADQGRVEIMRRWLIGEADTFGLETVGATIALISWAYECIARQNAGRTPVVRRRIPRGMFQSAAAVAVSR